MAQYRKGHVPAKGMHVRLDADLTTWLAEEADRRCLSRAAMLEMAVKHLRTRLTAIDRQQGENEDERHGHDGGPSYDNGP